jgi:hypothetical protein
MDVNRAWRFHKQGLDGSDGAASRKFKAVKKPQYVLVSSLDSLLAGTRLEFGKWMTNDTARDKALIAAVLRMEEPRRPNCRDSKREQIKSLS